MTEDRKTDAEVVRDLTAIQSGIRSTGSVPMAFLPEGFGVHSLERFLDTPPRIRESVRLTDVPSMAAYLDRFGSEETTIFADPDANKINAVLDYHGAGEPDNTDHTATMEVKPSEEWKAWLGLAMGQPTQQQMGEFLEERAGDIVKPEPADVIEAAMTLEATKRVHFRQSTRLRDGLVQLTYQEEDQTKGGIKLPERLTLSIPVFERGPVEQIGILLRFRIGREEGRLTFVVKVENVHDIERQAFERIVGDLKAAMKGDIAIYYGGR